MKRLTELPTEIVLNACLFLEGIDLLRLASTCKFFLVLVDSSLCSDLWKASCEARSKTWLSEFNGNGKIRQHYVECLRKELAFSRGKIVFSTLSGHHNSMAPMQFVRNTTIHPQSETNLAVWNTTTGECILQMKGHSDTITCLQAHDDYIVSGSHDQTCRVWNAFTGECLHEFESTACVCAVKFNTISVVFGDVKGTIHVYCITTGKMKSILKGHRKSIIGLQFDHKRIISSSLDNSLRVWNAEKGICEFVLTGFTQPAYSLQFDASIIVAGSFDKTVRVWNLEDGELVRAFEGHEGWITSVQIVESISKEKSHVIATGSQDKSIRLWNVAHGSCMNVFRGHNAVVPWIETNENDKEMISLGLDGQLIRWNLINETPLAKTTSKSTDLLVLMGLTRAFYFSSHASYCS